MHRSLLAIVVLATGFGSLAAVLGRDQPKPHSPTHRAALLPGVQANGAVQLPNQWSLRPAGQQVNLGDFPVNLALHPQGQWLAILHAGYGTHEIMLVDLKHNKVSSRVVLPQTFYGLCFAPDGKRLYASGGEFGIVHAYDFDDGLLAHHRQIRVANPRDRFVTSGLALDRAGDKLCACGLWAGAVAVVSLEDPSKIETIAIGKDSYPYACLFDSSGKRLYVSLWGQSKVAVIDLEGKKVIGRWATASHPTEMALTPNGQTLYVACSNSTRVSVLDAHTGRGLETIHSSLYPNAPSGNTPNSLALTPDGQLLFVANADANNVAVFNVASAGQAHPLGFIPVGWYPTSVRYAAATKKLYVANGKGVTPLANPQGPNTLLPRNKTVRQYIGGLLRGTLSIISMPKPAAMARLTEQAYACSPLRKDAGVTTEPPANNPVPRQVGDKSPIKHVLYIIKENRTYDQILGDMKEGNGDAALCLFPEKITPNHHRLAREFVLLDNLYCDGEVSADGHQWSMGAYATDFVEKLWPLSYRGSPTGKLSIYPSEGNFDAVARPAGGYLWDRCKEAGMSYRSYGEWIANGRTAKDPGKARVKTLEGHFDPMFRGFDLNYPDQKRVDEFLREFRDFENKGNLPQFIVMRLPNDHTAGTRVGSPTPTASVADNDLALGRVVEAISRSKYWKESAIFVIEDDAQNGSDHVDAHRTVSLVISPYTRHSGVDSSLYSTTSLLRTMELILGLKPMSQFDAAARPMYAAFHATADTRPYEHLVPDTDLKAKNRRTAWGANLSATFDLTQEDRVDDLLLNQVVWHAVRGPHVAMPPPVRAAFVTPHPRPRHDDDD